jgi:tetratricopeptide (TPR) repeat protein
LEWLGIQYYNEKNYQAAEKYLSALRKTDNAGKIKPDYLVLSRRRGYEAKESAEAEEAFAKYLQTAKDPAGKAKVLLTLGTVKISAHKPDEAQKIAEEIMALQPEGRVNAEARLLAGEVQLERGNFDDAGKAFKGVACSMTIQPSLHARWTKPRWHFVRPVRATKQIASRASCANVTRITSAGDRAIVVAQSRRYLETTAMPQGPSPTLIDAIPCAILHRQRRHRLTLRWRCRALSAGIERDTPDAVSDGNRCR